MTTEIGMALAVAVIALRALAELARFGKELLDARRGNNQRELVSTEDFKAGALVTKEDFKALHSTIASLREQMNIFVVSTTRDLITVTKDVELIRWRLDHPPEASP